MFGMSAADYTNCFNGNLYISMYSIINRCFNAGKQAAGSVWYNQWSR